MGVRACAAHDARVVLMLARLTVIQHLVDLELLNVTRAGS